MKKGQLSIETIIIVILALLVLVVVAIAFTGGMKNLWDQITGSGTVDLSTATQRCTDLCKNAGSNAELIKSTFCTKQFVIKDVGLMACKDLAPSAGCSCA